RARPARRVLRPVPGVRVAGPGGVVAAAAAHPGGAHRGPRPLTGVTALWNKARFHRSLQHTLVSPLFATASGSTAPCKGLRGCTRGGGVAWIPPGLAS